MKFRWQLQCWDPSWAELESVSGVTHNGPVSPVMVISLEISGPRRPGEPSTHRSLSIQPQLQHQPSIHRRSWTLLHFVANFTFRQISTRDQKVLYFWLYIPESPFSQALHFQFLQAHYYFPLVGSDRLCQHPREPQQQQTSKLAVESNLYWSLAADCGD